MNMETLEPKILDVRTLLERYALRAKKSWGQNFLIDERAYKAIVAACRIGPGDTAIEIGAGLGTLTSRLLATGANVIAVERERDMCNVLRAELIDSPRFVLREEDALKLDLAALRGSEVDPNQPKAVVVGNLPYQIATPLIFHFLSEAQRSHLCRMVFMLQREVADRLLAAPNSEAYGALTAQVALWATVERVCPVTRGGFIPAPRVDSMVVRITPLPSTRVPVRDPARYAQVVRAAFAQRRKTLRNALGSLFLADDLAAFAKTDIDLGRRGETLSVAEFAKLADALPK